MKKVYDFISIVISFHTLTTKLVKCFHRAFFFFNLRHPQKLVNSYSKHLGNSRDQLKVRISRTVFPAADRLICYTQAIGKCFLRPIVFLSEVTYIFSNCKFHFFLLMQVIALQSISFVDSYIIL